MAAAVWCKPNGQTPSSGKALCVFCIGHASRAKQSAQPAHWSSIFLSPDRISGGDRSEMVLEGKNQKDTQSRAGRQGSLNSSPPGRYHHPLNLLNLLNLPTDFYLSTNVSLSPCTEILRLRLRMTRPAGSPLNEGNTTFLHNLPRQRRPLAAEPPPSGRVK